MSDYVKIALIAVIPILSAQAITWYSNHTTLKDIHKVVNSRLDEALDRVERLEQTIRDLRSR